MYDEYLRRLSQLNDRSKVFLHIDRCFGKQARRNRERGLDNEQRIAIRRRASDKFGAASIPNRLRDYR
jgi:hypothetical protein